MINFLHAYHPEPILISLGPINIYWYGFFIVLAIITAIFITLQLASSYNIKKERIIDLSFWLIIGGIIGARFYHILLELPYYLKYPLDIIKIWQGGLAIHGSIIAGILILWFFSKKNKIDFFRLAAIIAPGLALGQAIGRWGNYFNQELFGPPTNLPWGIPINLINRPMEYISYNFFHPAFLYESLGNLIIFIILIFGHFFLIKYKKSYKKAGAYITLSYLALYSILRFFLEFIRIDATPIFLCWRWPQIASILIVILSLIILIKNLTTPSELEKK